MKLTRNDKAEIAREFRENPCASLVSIKTEAGEIVTATQGGIQRINLESPRRDV